MWKKFSFFNKYSTPIYKISASVRPQSNLFPMSFDVNVKTSNQISDGDVAVPINAFHLVGLLDFYELHLPAKFPVLCDHLQ
jgi:hypothetical protein